MSALGLQNDEELGSGRKHCTMSDCLSWSSRISVTACWNGHVSRASYSPLMIVRKKERHSRLPDPSPSMYRRRHGLYPNLLV